MTFSIDEWENACVDTADKVLSAKNNREGLAAIQAARELLATAYHLQGVDCRSCGGTGRTRNGGCEACWSSGRRDETGVDLNVLRQSSSMRWLTRQMSANRAVMQPALRNIAQHLRVATWPDYWTGRLASILAGALTRMGGK